MRNYRVTGPVDVPECTLAAMGGPMVSHRSAGFRDLLRGVLPRLGALFGTSGTVVPLTCSGTGGLEAAVASVLRPGDRVLSIQLGYFGERFAEIAAHQGARVDVLAAPWGQVVATEQITERLSSGYDAVLITHNETSTGVIAPLSEWARAIRSASDCLILVDVVSSLAATEIGFDALGLDIAVGVTQKALACPPGLSLAAASGRALARAAEPGEGSYYLSLARAAEHASQGTTAFTPALSVLYALDAALTAIEKEGAEAVWERHSRNARRLREAVRAQALVVVPAEADSSPTVTAVRLPVPRAEHVREMLAAAHDVWVSSGRGPWKSDVLRIGHMGPVEPADLDACAMAVSAVVRSMPATASAAATTRGAAAAGMAAATRGTATAGELGSDWDGLVARLEATWRSAGTMNCWRPPPRISRAIRWACSGFATASRHCSLPCGTLLTPGCWPPMAARPKRCADRSPLAPPNSTPSCGDSSTSAPAARCWRSWNSEGSGAGNWYPAGRCTVRARRTKAPTWPACAGPSGMTTSASCAGTGSGRMPGCTEPSTQG